MKQYRNLITYIGINYLTLLGGFALGLMVMHTKIWPYDHIFTTYHFIKGHADEDTGLASKILNDLGVIPSRHFGNSVPARTGDIKEISLEKLNARRDSPTLFKRSNFLDDFLLVTGIFDFEESLNGAILIDLKDSKVVHQWHLYDELFFDSKKFYDHHLFELLEDGSIIFAKDEGDGALHRYSACGELIWSIPGNFHHSISKRSDGLYWVLGSPVMPGQTKDSISLLDPHNGTIIKTLLLEEIHRKNAGTGIFDLNWTHIGQDDKYHPNDADPLTYSLVDQFVNFNEGDLLISYRHADLVYVLDPVTMKVKWWTQGLTSGQHDPDWQPDGSITVFDNAVHTNQRVNIQRFSDFRYNNGNSPPRSFRSEVIFDGGLSRLFTATRGRHQINRNGTLIMVVPDQGRAIAFSKDGHLLLDFINWYDEGRVLHLNNAELIERELVEIKNFSACKSK